MTVPPAKPEPGSVLTFVSINGGEITGYVAEVRGWDARVMDVLAPLEADGWTWSEWTDRRLAKSGKGKKP